MRNNKLEGVWSDPFHICLFFLVFSKLFLNKIQSILVGPRTKIEKVLRENAHNLSRLHIENAHYGITMSDDPKKIPEIINYIL